MPLESAAGLACYEFYQENTALQEGIIQYTPQLEHLEMSGLSIRSLNRTLGLISSLTVRLDFLSTLSVVSYLLTPVINMEINSPIMQALSQLSNLEELVFLGRVEFPESYGPLTPFWTCDISILARALSGLQSPHYMPLTLVNIII